MHITYYFIFSLKFDYLNTKYWYFSSKHKNINKSHTHAYSCAKQRLFSSHIIESKE